MDFKLNKYLASLIFLGSFTQQFVVDAALNLCTDEALMTATSNDTLEIRFNTTFALARITCASNINAFDNSSFSVTESIHFFAVSGLNQSRGNFTASFCYTNTTCNVRDHIIQNSTMQLNNVTSLKYTLLQYHGYGSNHAAGIITLSNLTTGLVIDLDYNYTEQVSIPAATDPLPESSTSTTELRNETSTTSIIEKNDSKAKARHTDEQDQTPVIAVALGGFITLVVVSVVVVIILCRRRNRMSNKPHGLRYEQEQEMELDVSCPDHVYSLQEHKTEDVPDTTAAMPVYAEVKNTSKLDRNRPNDNKDSEMNTGINKAEYDDNGRSKDEMQVHNNNIYFIEETNYENVQRNSEIKVVDNDVYESYDGNRGSNIANDSQKEAGTSDDKYFADNYVLAGEIKEN